MSYAIVHMQKIGKGGVRGIQSHNNREKPSRTNPDIDYNKSHENYDIIYSDNYHKSIKGSIENFATKTNTVRKDAVVMCNMLVTSDEKTMKDMPLEKQKSFFEDSVLFFANRYGGENIVNATVHMDETTPHMHVGIIPITADGRLSAKSMFDKKELKSLQTDFVREVGSRYGLERGVEGSERTHLSEVRFKAETAKKELEQVKLQEQEAVKNANKATEFARKTVNDAHKAQEGIKPLLEQQDALQGKIRLLEKRLKGRELTLHELNEICPEKGFMGAIKNITVEDIENLKKTAYMYYRTKDRLDEVSSNYEHDKRHIPSLDDRMKLIQDKRRLEQLEKAFNMLPQEVKEQLIPTKTQSQSRGYER